MIFRLYLIQFFWEGQTDEFHGIKKNVGLTLFSPQYSPSKVEKKCGIIVGR